MRGTCLYDGFREHIYIYIYMAMQFYKRPHVWQTTAITVSSYRYAENNPGNIIGLWKVSLNSDGKEFHQYQENEQSPFSSTHRTVKLTPTFPSWLQDLQRQYRYKQACTYSLPFKKKKRGRRGRDRMVVVYPTMQSVPITTDVVNSNLDHGEV